MTAHPRRDQLWLAGGINSENIVQVIVRYKPELIDSSSGLEQSPGKKDATKLVQFFNEIRRACRE